MTIHQESLEKHLNFVKLDLIWQYRPAIVDKWAAAALAVNPDVTILVHGGPVSMPEDAQYVLSNAKVCHGFYGASSMERLPTEVALTAQTKAFKDVKIG